VVERNRTKARSADCGFAEPEPPKGGEAVTVCYVSYLRKLRSPIPLIYLMFY